MSLFFFDNVELLPALSRYPGVSVLRHSRVFGIGAPRSCSVKVPPAAGELKQRPLESSSASERLRNVETDQRVLGMISQTRLRLTQSH